MFREQDDPFPPGVLTKYLSQEPRLHPLHTEQACRTQPLLGKSEKGYRTQKSQPLVIYELLNYTIEPQHYVETFHEPRSTAFIKSLYVNNS